MSRFPFAQGNYVRFFEDFHSYEGDQWIVTRIDGGTDAAQVIAVQDAANGVLLVTTNDADNDAESFQYSGDDDSGTAETFALVAGKRTYFGCRVKLADVVDSDFMIGLAVTDTTPMDAANGLFFLKPDDAALLTLKAISSDASNSVGNCGDLVADTWHKLEFYYNGVDRVFAYVDGVQAGYIPVTNLPTTELTLGFSIRTGAAAAKSLSVDYIEVVQER